MKRPRGPEQHAAEQAHRVALVSDTHGALDARVLEGLAGADLIVHAGDVGAAAVLGALTAIAPTLAVAGNNDVPGKWSPAEHEVLATLPEALAIALPGGTLCVAHGHQWPRTAVRHARLRAVFPAARCILYGHSHRFVIDEDEAPVVANPGAAGRSRTFGGAGWLGLTTGEHGWRLTRNAFG